MTKDSRNYSVNILIGLLAMVLLMTISAGLPKPAFAGKVDWDFSGTFEESFTTPIGLGKTDFPHIPYEVSPTVSGNISVKSPTDETTEVNIPNIGFKGFSYIFNLSEIGMYQFVETYTLTISSEDLGKSFSEEHMDTWYYNNDAPKIMLLQLDDMYINNYTYSAIPNDTIGIDRVTPSEARLGDIGTMWIKILRDIRANETIQVSVTFNAEWHKISSLVAPAFQYRMPEGWNWMNFYVNKCFYEGAPPTDQPACVELVNISDLGFNSLADWFSSVLMPGDAWLRVIGSGGVMDRTLPSIFNTLKYMSPISGYQVLISEGTGGAVISINGPLYDPNCVIPLQQGWNLIAYPLTVGYYDTDSPPSVNVPEGTIWIRVSPPVAKHVFQTITGKYNIITSDSGSYDPNLPDIFSSLHYVAPGRAYWIDMYETADLVYPAE